MQLNILTYIRKKIQMNHRFKCKNGVIKVLEITVREFAIIVEW